MDNSQIENTITEIRKRSGAVTAFNKNKISNAIYQALAATSKADRGLADQLADNVVNKLVEQGFTSTRTPTVEDIQDIVSKLKEKNIGILITDHNVQETLHIVDRANLLFEGSILKTGTAEELAADEQVRRVYLGQNFKLRKQTN